MKVLVVGGGGREHALVWKIARSPLVKEIYSAPGNAGISRIARCIPISAKDIPSLKKFAIENEIDLTVVGPEDPLTMGIVDEFERDGLKIFGPDKRAAIIEGSKVFARDLMRKYNIPSPYYETFSCTVEAIDYLENMDFPVVVKADGLAAGKGVIICDTIVTAEKNIKAIMNDKIFGESGNEIILEEYLEGEEASFLIFTDGETVLPMVSSQDHKPIFDDDKGPNTGGMGAYAPAPVIDEKLYNKIMDKIMVPAVRAMSNEGRKYKGVLYGGLMISGEDVKVLEFNARFGDPEAQPILTLLENDIIPILLSIIEENLSSIELTWKKAASVCIVVASGGYPGTYSKGKEISGIDEVEKLPEIVIFHAGTSMKENKFVTSGGRVIGITALGSDLKDAIDKAYCAANRIYFEGIHFRKDIGKKALKRLKLN